MSRQVEVVSEERAITFYDKKMQLLKLGEIRVENYQDEVKRWLFAPGSQNPWSGEHKQEKPYQLGTGSKNLVFVNPSEAQEVLLNMGWVIADQYATRGGLSMVTVFILADRPFQDSITYDHDLWSNRKGMDKIWPCIQLETNLMLGRIAARYSGGIFRQICVNGATGKVLDLGEADFRHNEWNVDDVIEEIEAAKFGSISALPMGPVIASNKGLKAAIGFLDRYLEERASDSGLTARFKLMEDVLSPLSSNVVKPWVLTNYSKHLKTLSASHLQSGEIHMFDLLNAYTSGVNEHRMETRSSRAAFASMYMADSVVKLTSHLASISELFSN